MLVFLLFLQAVLGWSSPKTMSFRATLSQGLCPALPISVSFSLILNPQMPFWLYLVCVSPQVYLTFKLSSQILRFFNFTFSLWVDMSVENLNRPGHGCPKGAFPRGNWMFLVFSFFFLKTFCIPSEEPLQFFRYGLIVSPCSLAQEEIALVFCLSLHSVFIPLLLLHFKSVILSTMAPNSSSKE